MDAEEAREAGKYDAVPGHEFSIETFEEEHGLGPDEIDDEFKEIVRNIPMTRTRS